jgi:hypothetical protein
MLARSNSSRIIRVCMALGMITGGLRKLPSLALG